MQDGFALLIGTLIGLSQWCWILYEAMAGEGDDDAPVKPAVPFAKISPSLGKLSSIF